MNRSYLAIVIPVVIVFAISFALAPTTGAKPRVQQFTVKISERGFEPETLKVRRGVPTRITFLRTTDNTCAKEIVISEFGVRRELPLNQPIVVSFTPNKKGEFSFTCGMNMMRGKLIVQ
jgi:plastocyanin domain-containing protein